MIIANQGLKVEGDVLLRVRILGLVVGLTGIGQVPPTPPLGVRDSTV